MEIFMKVENFVNKKFTNGIIRSLPKVFHDVFTWDEIQSEVYFAIVNSSKSYDSKKTGVFNFVRHNTINLLNVKLRKLLMVREREVPIEAAYEKSYSTNHNDVELLAYFRTLPTEWLSELTEFVLGKKKKEEIAISNDPSFDRVLEKIDMMV